LLEDVDDTHPAFEDSKRQVDQRIERLLSIRGHKTVDEFHRELGKILWDSCGISRNEMGLLKARDEILALRDRFWDDLLIPGRKEDLNQSLEKAIRVADFFDFSLLMIEDALHRKESCGCHFMEEYQTEEGEPKRNDEEYAYVAAWEYQGDDSPPKLHKESLVFEFVELTERSYK